MPIVDYVSASSWIQIFPDLIFKLYFVNLKDGSSWYLPVLKSKRQSWQGQTIKKPSRVPPEKAQPMCGQRLSIAKIWLDCLISKTGEHSTDTSFIVPSCRSFSSKTGTKSFILSNFYLCQMLLVNYEISFVASVNCIKLS